jgi:hypothetical protein
MPAVGAFGRALVFAVVLAAAALAGRPAGAQAGLDRARALYLEADFDGALAVLREVLESADLDRAAAAEAHRYLATLTLASGDAAAARAHAAAAVALEPAVTAPEGAPTELDGILDQVREERGSQAAAIVIEAQGPGLARERQGDVTARLEGAPPGLVSRLALRCGEGDEAVEAEGASGEVSVRLTPGGRERSVRCVARAGNEAGAAVLEAAAELDVARNGTEGPGARGPLWAWLVGVGGGLVLVGVITAVAVVVASPDEAYLETPRVEGW